MCAMPQFSFTRAWRSSRIGLFLIHVYMSTILEEGSFGSMIHGYVTRAWAWTFHRTWYYEVTGKTPPKS